MYELKTKPNNSDVQKFLDNIIDLERRRSCITLCEIMRQITQSDPVMWGNSIVGFGLHSYKNKRGDQSNWFKTGFSPRKNYIAIYTIQDLNKKIDLLDKLGNHKRGKACIYIKTLKHIDTKILRQLLENEI